MEGMVAVLSSFWTKDTQRPAHLSCANLPWLFKRDATCKKTWRDDYTRFLCGSFLSCLWSLKHSLSLSHFLFYRDLEKWLCFVPERIERRMMCVWQWNPVQAISSVDWGGTCSFFLVSVVNRGTSLLDREPVHGQERIEKSFNPQEENPCCPWESRWSREHKISTSSILVGLMQTILFFVSRYTHTDPLSSRAKTWWFETTWRISKSTNHGRCRIFFGKIEGANTLSRECGFPWPSWHAYNHSPPKTNPMYLSQGFVVPSNRRRNRLCIYTWFASPTIIPHTPPFLHLKRFRVQQKKRDFVSHSRWERNNQCLSWKEGVATSTTPLYRRNKQITRRRAQERGRIHSTSLGYILVTHLMIRQESIDCVETQTKKFLWKIVSVAACIFGMCQNKHPHHDGDVCVPFHQ